MQELNQGLLPLQWAPGLFYDLIGIQPIPGLQSTTSNKGVRAMGRMKENPRYNVISLRISDVERKELEQLMERTHKSISHVMREAIEYFATHHE